MQEDAVKTCNVIPFRPRGPSKQELEVYRWMTRRWSPGLRRLMLPQYFPFAEQSVAAAEPPELTQRSRTR